MLTQTIKNMWYEHTKRIWAQLRIFFNNSIWKQRLFTSLIDLMAATRDVNKRCCHIDLMAARNVNNGMICRQWAGMCFQLTPSRRFIRWRLSRVIVAASFSEELFSGRNQLKFWRKTRLHFTETIIFLFPFTLNGIWSLWQFIYFQTTFLFLSQWMGYD